MAWKYLAVTLGICLAFGLLTLAPDVTAQEHEEDNGTDLNMTIRSDLELQCFRSSLIQALGDAQARFAAGQNVDALTFELTQGGTGPANSATYSGEIGFAGAGSWEIMDHTYVYSPASGGNPACPPDTWSRSFASSSGPSGSGPVLGNSTAYDCLLHMIDPLQVPSAIGQKFVQGKTLDDLRVEDTGGNVWRGHFRFDGNETVILECVHTGSGFGTVVAL